MKRTILMLVALLSLMPAAMRAQQGASLYDSGWGIGFQLGVGGLLPTGSLADDLKGCVLFTGGLNAEYGRMRLKADVAYGQPSFKNANPYNVRDDQGRDLQLNASTNPTLLGIGVQLGYTVWRHGRVSVSPMVGFDWHRLSWELNHIKYERDDEGQQRPVIDNVTATHEGGFGWIASVDIDIKLHGKLVDSPLGSDNQAHYTSSVRITPFVTRARYNGFNPAVKGICLGATVTYAGLLRLLP